ncbi:cupin domain-containing protein [Rhodobacteraceae bacterium NNCM2]|nr:cupin domain-containing protein [Coraliihabitans acroporae]
MKEGHGPSAGAADAAREFIRALGADLAARSWHDPALQPFVEELARVDTAVQPRALREPFDHPTMSLLGPELARAAGPAPVCEAARAAAAQVDWNQVFIDDKTDRALVDGLLAAQVVGPFGLFRAETVAAGFFLLSPGVHYPLHTHEAAEIYYALSGRLEIQHGVSGQAFTLSGGGYSVTPSNRLHALTTGEEPVLMIYLWTGRLACTNWWWARDRAGDWRRTGWQKDQSGAWKVVGAEPVTPAVMAEAHS